jgi:hypothetical protein
MSIDFTMLNLDGSTDAQHIIFLKTHMTFSMSLRMLVYLAETIVKGISAFKYTRRLKSGRVIMTGTARQLMHMLIDDTMLFVTSEVSPLQELKSNLEELLLIQIDGIVSFRLNDSETWLPTTAVYYSLDQWCDICLENARFLRPCVFDAVEEFTIEDLMYILRYFDEYNRVITEIMSFLMTHSTGKLKLGKVLHQNKKMAMWKKTLMDNFEMLLKEEGDLR